jgi:hypothetical protein
VGAFAGRFGTIIEVQRTLAGHVDGSRVKLDEGQPAAPEGKAGVFFASHELESVATKRKGKAP